MSQFGSIEIPVYPGVQIVEANGHPMSVQNNGSNTIYLSDNAAANPNDSSQVTPFAVNQTASFDGSVPVYATALPNALGSVIRFPGSTNFFQPAKQVGKATISATQPSNPNVGDIWFDTSSDNAMFQWDGSNWTAVPFGTTAIAAGSITTSLIAAGTIVAGIVDGTTITGAELIATNASSGGGIFVYTGTAGLGNPPIANISNGTVDPFGNTVSPLANFGPISGAHFGIDRQGQLYLSNASGNTIIFASPGEEFIGVYGTSHQSGDYPYWAVAAIATSDKGNNIPQGNVSQIPLLLYDGTPAANSLYAAITPVAASDSFNNFWNGEQGMFKSLVAVDPTITTGTNPESWKSLGSISATGYTKQQGQARISPDAGDFVQFDIQLTANSGGGTAGTYAFATSLPSAYRPARTQTLPLAQSATLIGGAVYPCVTVTTAGVVSIKVGAYAAGTVLTCSARMSLN